MKLSSFIATSCLFSAMFRSAFAEDLTLAERYELENLSFAINDPVTGQHKLTADTPGVVNILGDTVRFWVRWRSEGFVDTDSLDDICDSSDSVAGGYSGASEGLANLGLPKVSYLKGAKSEFVFELNENLMTSPIFLETSPGEGIVRFCASWATVNGGASINFKQLAVQMTLSLDGDYTVSDMTFQRHAIATDATNSLAYGVTADNCGDDSVYLPGEPVRVCVCATEWPITSITRLVDMTEIVTSGSIGEPQLTEDINSCVPGGVNEQCCEIHRLFSVSHFPATVGATKTKSISGMVELTLGDGTRRLVSLDGNKGARELQDGESKTVNKEFETEVILLNSSAMSSTLTSFALLVTAGLVALIHI